MNDIAPFLIGGVFAVFGVVIFLSGFRDLRFRRLIANTPVSKARSVAMGMAEIAGVAKMMHPMRDPVFDQPCAFYRVSVHRRQKSGKNHHWVLVHRESSDTRPFIVEDSTGSVPVFPAGAQVHLESAIRVTVDTSAWGMVGILASGANPIEQYLQRFPRGTLKLEADILRDGFPVFLVGFAKSAARFAETPDEREAARRLKKDAARMAKLDTNRDGRLDPAEWEAGLRAFVEELAAARRVEATADANPNPVFIDRGPYDMLLFSETEKHLLKALGVMSTVKVVVGPLLAVLGGWVCLNVAGAAAVFR